MKFKTGNLIGSGGNRDGNGKQKANRESRKGYYKTVLVESYRDVSDKDIELRYEYGKDLVGNYLGYSKYILHLTEKKSTQTLLGHDEVLYVRLGKDVLGKLSISYIRTYKGANLSFIYQKKGLSSGKAKRSNSKKINQRKRSRESNRTDKRRM